VKNNDGGPAFPVPGLQHDEAFNGISVRDYLAAHAPISLIDANEAMHQQPQTFAKPVGEVFPLPLLMKELVRMRYEYADAMLSAREGGAV